jgi:hypothetical protein
LNVNDAISAVSTSLRSILLWVGLAVLTSSLLLLLLLPFLLLLLLPFLLLL